LVHKWETLIPKIRIYVNKRRGRSLLKLILLKFDWCLRNMILVRKTWIKHKLYMGIDNSVPIARSEMGWTKCLVTLYDMLLLNEKSPWCLLLISSRCMKCEMYDQLNEDTLYLLLGCYWPCWKFPLCEEWSRWQGIKVALKANPNFETEDRNLLKN